MKRHACSSQTRWTKIILSSGFETTLDFLHFNTMILQQLFTFNQLLKNGRDDQRTNSHFDMLIKDEFTQSYLHKTKSKILLILISIDISIKISVCI